MASLKLDRQKRIDSVVEDIQLRTGLTYPEDGLIDLVKALGVEVYTVDLSHYGDNVDGVIEYDPTNEDRAKIYVNDSFNDERKTFTLAHELGHLLLHNDGQTKYRVDKYDYSKDNTESHQETEANYFAATLLVPEDKLIRLLKVVGMDLDRLSEYFGVSKAVIRNRVKWIKRNSKNL